MVLINNLFLYFQRARYLLLLILKAYLIINLLVYQFIQLIYRNITYLNGRLSVIYVNSYSYIYIAEKFNLIANPHLLMYSVIPLSTLYN